MWLTVSYGDEISVFDLSGPGELNRNLRMPLIKSEIIPHDFYTKTCQQKAGDSGYTPGWLVSVRGASEPLKRQLAACALFQPLMAIVLRRQKRTEPKPLV